MTPDILVMAKGLASGFPISAIAASEALMSKWTAGAHGGTYGGNILGCAAAIATIETILEEKLVENAAQRGQQLMDGLIELQSSIPVIGDVRGLGLMVGVEMTDPKTRQPDAAFAKQVITNSLEQGNMILMTCGTDANTVRWIPPLIVTEQQIDDGLHIFRNAAEQAFTSRKKS